MDSESESECNWDRRSHMGSDSVSETNRKKRGTPEETPKNPDTREYLRQYENESNLPVTCGDKKGTLNKEKFKKEQKCIFSEDQWFKPSEFEKFGGKEKNKKWKTSIFCNRIPLQKFIEDGFLPPFKKHIAQNKQTGAPESTPATGRLRKKSNDDDDDVDMTVFERPTLSVTCGSKSGILHKYRFAKGRCGRCIRTEDFWLTPEDFMRQAKPDGIWKKDIVTYGKPLGKLIMERVLKLHALACVCDICKDSAENQQNDDVCFVCDTGGDLVCCDGCPRAFHPHCHLPALDEDLPEGQWSCTFCVIKNMEDSSQKTQHDVLSSPVSKYTLHCQCLLLHLLHESRTDLCTSVPGYSENICGPIMLGRVKMNLESNNYQTVQEFVKDIEYVFHQCTHRDEDSSRMTSKLREVFQKEFETVFKIL